MRLPHFHQEKEMRQLLFVWYEVMLLLFPSRRQDFKVVIDLPQRGSVWPCGHQSGPWTWLEAPVAKRLLPRESAFASSSIVPK